jgi:hypothetical protein
MGVRFDELFLKDDYARTHTYKFEGFEEYGLSSDIVYVLLTPLGLSSVKMASSTMLI